MAHTCCVAGHRCDVAHLPRRADLRRSSDHCGISVMSNARWHERLPLSLVGRGKGWGDSQQQVFCHPPPQPSPTRGEGLRGSVPMTGAVLSPGTAALILFGGFFLCMLLRGPVAFALGLACLPILIIEPRLDTMSLMQETFNAYNSFILLAVPFFLLTANLMNVGGTTDRLMKLSRTMVGHFPGS